MEEPEPDGDPIRMKRLYSSTGLQPFLYFLFLLVYRSFTFDEVPLGDFAAFEDAATLINRLYCAVPGYSI